MYTSVCTPPPADTFHDQPTSAPTLYIAKFSYTPAEQSPNPTFDQELPLTAGDYVYVYGEMDGDGFFQGRLVSGATGLVPSNFVERISEDESEWVWLVSVGVAMVMLCKHLLYVFLSTFVVSNSPSPSSFHDSASLYPGGHPGGGRGELIV